MWFLHTPGLALRSVNFSDKVQQQILSFQQVFIKDVLLMFVFTGDVPLQKRVEYRA